MGGKRFWVKLKLKWVTPNKGGDEVDGVKTDQKGEGKNRGKNRGPRKWGAERNGWSGKSNPKTRTTIQSAKSE